MAQPTNASQPHQYSPRTLTVACGTKVTITDNDSSNDGASQVKHTWSSTSHLWNSGTLHLGDSYSYTFRSVGTFTFMCFYHDYMTGSIHVT